MKVVSLFLANMAFLATHSLADAPTDAFKNEVLSQHNTYRAQYGAGPLTWSDALFPDTLQWANTCTYQFSPSAGKYGENLYAGVASGVSFSEGIQIWMDQAPEYNYAKADFDLKTGSLEKYNPSRVRDGRLSRWCDFIFSIEAISRACFNRMSATMCEKQQSKLFNRRIL
ncbi:hypothetical protein BGZ94_001396 [Podila epigama]|nr:hypothetical protein BGZ94_001396 [Podila epigama]